MADYFVRTTGSDAQDGTTPAKAWLTIGKAVTSVAAGDTIWVGGGTYRISAAIAPSSMASMTYLRGDTDGSHTGDPGEVVLTTYATSDTSAPTTVRVLQFASKSNWTVSGLTLISGGAQSAVDVTGTSANIIIQDCSIWSLSSGSAVNVSAVTWGTTTRLTVERCRLWSNLNSGVNIACPANASGADYSMACVVRNCLIVAGTRGVLVSGTNSASRSGGITVANCTIQTTAGSPPVQVITANGISPTYPVLVYNCLILGGGTGIQAATAGQITSNYNIIAAATALANVTQGANDVIDGSRMWRFSLGHEASFGAPVRPFGEPVAGSPLLAFGSYAGITDDIAGNPRPGSGNGSVAGAVGAFERRDSGTRDNTTYHTSAPSLKIAGPGVQEWSAPVTAAPTTITAWVRWDGSYTGTKPSISVRQGGEAGVSTATATAAGSASAWEQLTLTFTPTAAGVVTVRFTSADTSGSGSAWVDDIEVHP